MTPTHTPWFWWGQYHAHNYGITRDYWHKQLKPLLTNWEPSPTHQKQLHPLHIPSLLYWHKQSNWEPFPTHPKPLSHYSQHPKMTPTHTPWFWWGQWSCVQPAPWVQTERTMWDRAAARGRCTPHYQPGRADQTTTLCRFNKSKANNLLMKNCTVILLERQWGTEAFYRLYREIRSRIEK